MIVLRRRLIFWLVKAYLKKLGKRIFLFFLLGLLFFFFLRFAIAFTVARIPVGQKEVIGMVGVYTTDNLPSSVLSNISYGLTSVSIDGKPVSAAAKEWKIQNNGKTYIFYLKKNQYFSDGTNLTSSNINYNFSDAKVSWPDKYTIIFNLKDSYSPFLITVSKPIFKDNFVGLNEYRITDIKLNGNFVQSISVTSVKDRFKTKTYQFYPSNDALKIAFLLGEINKGIQLSDIYYKNQSFESFENVKIERKINDKTLATLFYNNLDPILSDKKVRNALSYTLPDKFLEGEKAYSLFPSSSWAYTNLYAKMQDLEHAKILLSAADSSTKSASLKLDVKTFPKYKKTAELISNSWKKIGVETKIEVVENVPTSFQIFLGDFHVPSDPDQYSLWHSNQDNNITNYKSLRIDKLLEDGRKITDTNERKKIYLDLQKYLIDETPASFLFFPYEYEMVRK